MEFFRNYVGLEKHSVEDFTNWVPDTSKFIGGIMCLASDSTAEAQDDAGGCYHAPQPTNVGVQRILVRFFFVKPRAILVPRNAQFVIQKNAAY